MLLNRGTISKSKFTWMGQNYSARVIGEFQSDGSPFHGFKDEIRQGTEEILSTLHPLEKGKGIKNSVGRYLKVNNRRRESYYYNGSGRLRRTISEKTKGSTKLSHILNGYEQFCLNLVCSKLSDVQAVIYDGWIAESPIMGMKYVERQISVETERQLGVPIHLKIKKKKIPRTVTAILNHFA